MVHLTAAQESTVLVADSLLGPYEVVGTGIHPLGMNAGDFDLVVEPTDGKAYYYFERVHSELICADLTDDFTGTTGYYSTHFAERTGQKVREAPAYFRRGDDHYLITSGITGYRPNQSEVSISPTYHGPFTLLGDPHSGDQTNTSFRSQVSSVFKHPEKRDLYIALADRWLPVLDATSVDTDESANEDTSIADYVWLPIRFEDSRPFIDWRDEWSLDEFD
jgi:hypothetical protein